jgi:serine/threonine protein phosphatase PrpC
LLQLSNAGGRIIIASDGVWDDLTSEMALDCSRGFPSDIAANRIVNVTNHDVLDKFLSNYLVLN